MGERVHVYPREVSGRYLYKHCAGDSRFSKFRYMWRWSRFFIRHRVLPLCVRFSLTTLSAGKPCTFIGNRLPPPYVGFPLVIISPRRSSYFIEQRLPPPCVRFPLVTTLPSRCILRMTVSIHTLSKVSFRLLHSRFYLHLDQNFFAATVLLEATR